MVSLAPNSGGPFSHAVVERLSIDERMYYETYRLQSFENWPFDAYKNVRPMDLARAGFYYIEQGDVVKCYSCGSHKGQWQSRSIPRDEHERLNPNCSHLKGEDSRNVPLFVPSEEDCSIIWRNLHERFCPDSAPLNYSTVTANTCNVLSTPGEDNNSSVNNSRQDLRNTGINPSSQPLQINTSSLYDSHTRSDSRTPFQSTVPHLIEENQQMSEEARLLTFGERWPHRLPTPTDLVKAGFSFSGIADQVQCVFCKGILKNWEEGDIPMSEHMKHFPNCSFIQKYKQSLQQRPADIPAIYERMDSSAPSNVPTNLFSPISGVHTDRPRHPHYATETSRIATYTSWPSGKSQTPQQLAKAGFFYAGYEDNVKCFFCDGGLRTWERGDDPWEEHAKYFARCQYVLQVKGEAFVQQFHNSSNTLPQASGGMTGTENSSDIDQKVASKIDLPVVKDVLKMGVPKDVVVNVIKERMQSTGEDFPSISDLLDAIYHANDQIQQPTPLTEASGVDTNTKKDTNTIDKNITGGDTDSNADHESLILENQRLKEQRTCKICMDEEANIVLLPCGHLVSCATCAPALRKCPICRANIKGTVRTYLS